MRKLFLLLCLSPFFLTAQEKDSTFVSKLSQAPRHSIGLEVMNFYDDYPAVLLTYEYQWNEDLAVQLEGGPVVQPEAYDSPSFIDYSGYKTRAEVKLYIDENDLKGSRIWLGLDVFYQNDSYTDDYEINHGNYIEFATGDFGRRVIASHIRVGNQRFFSDGNIIVSWSAGVGRAFFTINSPSEDLPVSSVNWIRDYSPLDPISVNIRLNLAYSFIRNK